MLGAGAKVGGTLDLVPTPSVADHSDSARHPHHSADRPAEAVDPILLLSRPLVRLGRRQVLETGGPPGKRLDGLPPTADKATKLVGDILAHSHRVATAGGQLKLSPGPGYGLGNTVGGHARQDHARKQCGRDGAERVQHRRRCPGEL